MASKEQRKLQKRKAREKDNRQQLLLRRQKATVVAREEREDIRRARRIAKLQRDLEKFDQVMDMTELAIASDNTLSQLEKNIEILKALEDEHNREVQKRQELNEQLEQEGCYTLEDKLKVAGNLRPKTDMGIGGTADCKFSVNKKETAEVSVVKAPLAENTENS